MKRLNIPELKGWKCYGALTADIKKWGDDYCKGTIKIINEDLLNPYLLFEFKSDLTLFTLRWK